MSRVIVKNLPKHVDENRLRQHFAQAGEVTDAKVMRKDGITRRFGFVGFKTEKDAKQAVNKLNKTYLDTSKLQVSIALGIGDDTIPRPWSKYSKGSSAFEKKLSAQAEKAAKEAKKKEDKDNAPMSPKTKAAAAAAKKPKVAAQFKKGLDIDTITDPKLKEFLSVMQVRSKKKFWANDDGLGLEVREAKVEMVPNRKAGGEGLTLKRMHVTFDEDDISGDDDDEFQDLPTSKSASKPEDGDDGSSNDVDTATDTNAQPVSVKDFLKQKTVRNFDDDDNSEVSDFDKDADADDNATSHKKTKNLGVNSKHNKTDKTNDEGNDGDDDASNGNNNTTTTATTTTATTTTTSTTSSNNNNNKTNKSTSKSNAKQNIDLIMEDADDTNKKTTNDDNNNNDHDNDDADKDKSKDSAKDREAAERAAQSGRLFVRNLAFSIDEDDLKPLFSKYGTVLEIHIPMDKSSQKSKGVAYVQYDKAEDALQAQQTIDGSILFGRLVHVLQAQPKPEAVVTNEKDGRTMKKKKESMQERAWNSLFIRQDTVASATAARLGVAKSELLDTDRDGSAAVRIALSEAALVQETKAMLEEEGISIVALDPSQKTKRERSSTILLVKNIPFDITVEEIETLFGRFGALLRVILPPTRTLAIVEFGSASEAKTAFRRLAFSNLRQLPLMLEWAPVGVFTKPAKSLKNDNGDDNTNNKTESSAATNETPNNKDSKSGKAEQQQAGKSSDSNTNKRKNVNSDDDDDDKRAATPASTRTLFCKNLAFTTTIESLKQAFENRKFRVKSVRIPQKKVLGSGETSNDPKKSANSNNNSQQAQQQGGSLGYGFVEFETAHETERALREAQGMVLEGRAVALQRSQRVDDVDTDKVKGNKKYADDNSKQKPSTKLLVRNIPFEANRNEVKELFGSIAEIKSVRLPRKFDGTFRGFAFIECLTKKEAAKAMELLRNSHLYGRHLVIEYAKDDEDVSELRERVKEHFVTPTSANERPAKRQKLKFADDDDDFVPLM